jgi:putative proteasome-type protease
VGPPFELVVIEAGEMTISRQIKVEADDPSLDEMIDTWVEAQREALYRLPRLPWEREGRE